MSPALFALLLIFQDGYMGGHTTVAEFHDKATCDRYGAAEALQYTSSGHPASYLCAPVDHSHDKDPAYQFGRPETSQVK